MPQSLLSTDRLDVIRRLCEEVKHLPGSIAEVGVYRGGTAYMMASILPKKTIHLFDTFEGMPISGPGDVHKVGEFKLGDITLDELKMDFCTFKAVFHVGLFPSGIRFPYDDRFCIVHIDADQYQSTLDAIELFRPVMVSGGVMVFDDYEWKSCPGVKRAIEEYFGSTMRVIKEVENQGYIRL